LVARQDLQELVLWPIATKASADILAPTLKLRQTTAMAYMRAERKYGLSVEKGTDRVPDDGKYHLLVDDEIVLSTPVEALALAEMEEAKATRQAQGRELLQREMAASDVRAFRAGNYAEKHGRDQRKGGRGMGRR
jgi:hypothetical protein